MYSELTIAKASAVWLLRKDKPASALWRTESGAFSEYRNGLGRPAASVMIEATAVALNVAWPTTTASLRAFNVPSS